MFSKMGAMFDEVVPVQKQATGVETAGPLEILSG